MYHFNDFSSSFPGKLADGELINGSNKEAARIVPTSLSPGLICMSPFVLNNSTAEISA